MQNEAGQVYKHFELSDKNFRYLRELIYREAGINLTESKKCLVQTRIGKMMRRSEIDGYEALFKLMENDRTGQYLEALLNYISTNHTFFFREDNHFKALSEIMVPDLVKQSVKHIRIWSAGCSSGEEPYTLAITMMETLKRFPTVSFSIFASDLSTTVLHKAMSGVYALESIENLPIELKKRYFKKGKDEFADLVKVRDEVRDKVVFKRHNLLQPLEGEADFHIIFCRNVMIYFDQDTKSKIVHSFYKKVLPGGYFITGHSESINSFKHPFTPVRPTIYKRST